MVLCIFCNGADSMKQKLFQFSFFFALARQKECNGPKAKCEKKLGERVQKIYLFVHQTIFFPGWKHFIAIRLTIVNSYWHLFSWRKTVSMLNPFYLKFELVFFFSIRFFCLCLKNNREKVFGFVLCDGNVHWCGGFLCVKLMMRTKTLTHINREKFHCR